MEREDKPAPASESIGSRPSSRTSSPSISGSNSKKFTYVSQMDPGMLEKSASLKDAADWWERMQKFMKIAFLGGYSIKEFKLANLNNVTP